MSGRISLLLGGARAGKSTLAERLAAACGPHVLFIATAEPLDADMVQRIALHRAGRPKSWVTVEAPRDPAGCVPAGRFDAVVVDCATLWIANLLEASGSEALEGDAANAFFARINTEVDRLITVARGTGVPWFIVSNEVGLGVVPAYALGRMFRDALGRANQRLAAGADDVALVVAGLPLTLKGRAVTAEGGTA